MGRNESLPLMSPGTQTLCKCMVFAVIISKSHRWGWNQDDKVNGETDIKQRLMNWKTDSEHVYRTEVSETHKI